MLCVLLIILAIIIVLYFVFTRINVVHIDKLKDHVDNPEHLEQYIQTKNQQPVVPKIKLGSEKITSEINLSEGFDNVSESESCEPDAAELIEYIEEEHLERDYCFNLDNNPVSTKYPSNLSKIEIKRYKKLIGNDISTWLDDSYFSGLNIKSIDILFVKEADVEYYVRANVKLEYLAKMLCLEIAYYMKKDILDDFLSGGNNHGYELQLIDIKPISLANYQSKISFACKKKGPFMSLEDQMKQVEEINKMHENEAQYYRDCGLY